MLVTWPSGQRAVPFLVGTGLGGSEGGGDHPERLVSASFAFPGGGSAHPGPGVRQEDCRVVRDTAAGLFHRSGGSWVPAAGWQGWLVGRVPLISGWLSSESGVFLTLGLCGVRPLKGR